MHPERLLCDLPYGAAADRPGASAFFIPGACGRLLSLLYTSGGSGPHPCVLLLHGFPGNEQNLDLAQMLRRVGFHVLTMHYSGSWGSDGAFSFAHALDDARRAFQYLASPKNQREHHIDGHNLFVLGHSMGGFVALHLLADEPTLRAGVALAPYDFGRMAKLARNDRQANDALMALLEEGAPWLVDTSPNKLQAELDQSTGRFDLHEKIQALSQKELYLIGASLDDCAKIEIHCSPLVRKLKKLNPTCVDDETLETDHCFSDMRITMAKIVTNWLLTKTV